MSAKGTMNDEQLIEALVERLEKARPYVAKFDENRLVRVELVLIDKTLAQAERRKLRRTNPLLTPEGRRGDWHTE
jgi:hypothetical protein